MKLIEKLENIKLKNKLVIITGLIVLIAIFNFLFYNYETLKLPKEQRYYTIAFNDDMSVDSELVKEVYIEDDNTNILLNLNNKYVNDFLISYDSDETFDFYLTGEMGNYYKVLSEQSLESNCKSFINDCGISIEKNMQNVTLSVNKSVKLNKITIDNKVYFNFKTFFFWVITIISITSIFLFNKSFYKNKHYLALLLCLSIGSILLITEHNMTGSAADDHIHFSNINMISKEKSSADTLLENLKVTFAGQDTRVERKAVQNYLNEESKNKFKYSDLYSLLVYSRINYLPMALTKFFCTKIGFNFTTTLIITRIIHLLIYSFIIMLAVKIIPTLKNFTLMIGVLPQSLFLATNFSYDPTVSAFFILAFAAFVNEYHNRKEKIKIKNILIFLLASLYGCFPKLVYAPILLLPLLLPKEKFYTKKQCIIFKLFIIFLCFLVLLPIIYPFFFPSILESTSGDIRGGNVSLGRQLTLMIKHPLSFSRVFWESGALKILENLFSEGTFFLLSYYGGINVETSYYLLLFGLLVAFLSEKDINKISFKDRIFILFTICLIIGLINVSMYLMFTPVGNHMINGVQSRYFIPLIIPFVYCFSSLKIKNNINDKNAMTLCSIISIISTSLILYFTIVKVYCL